MNLVAFIFYVISKVIQIPMGSKNEFEKTEEDANNWYKKIKETPVGKKYLEAWWFKIALLLIGIVWLIPYLRDKMIPKKEPIHDPQGTEEAEYVIIED